MRYSILLIITGSIAAYKSLELIRRLRERDLEVRCILTKGGTEFITPLSVASLSENQVYGELFSLKDETEMGHIQLSRQADLVVVAPASADIMTKMAQGTADDLASATLLACNKPIMIAPAMNTQMWDNPATQRNVQQLKQDGIAIIAPEAGSLACGETGSGRMADPDTICAQILKQLEQDGPLSGKHVLVTSGPTHEAIDPVRYIANRSSGKQGHAIAEALIKHGATVTLVSGPTNLEAPKGATIKNVISAEDMLKACDAALPADIAICAAAVADWRVSQPTARKLKKAQDGQIPSLRLIENPDILAHLAQHPKHRPNLVIGFAAETDNVIEHATQKRLRKGCDWILANDVSEGKGFDREHNTISLINASSVQNWPEASKTDIAQQLVETIIDHLKKDQTGEEVA